LTDDSYRGSELEQDPLWGWQKECNDTARNTGFHAIKVLCKKWRHFKCQDASTWVDSMKCLLKNQLKV